MASPPSAADGDRSPRAPADRPGTDTDHGGAGRGNAGWGAPPQSPPPADAGEGASGWGAPSKAREDQAGWDGGPSKPAAAGEDAGAWGAPSQGSGKNAGWDSAPSRPRSPPASSEGPQRPVLFVNNLSTETDNRDLEEVFRKFGNIKKVSIMFDPHTRESRGFAFVDFETVEDAQNAAKGVADITLHGRQIHAELARRGRPRTPTPGRYSGMPKREPRGPPFGRNDNFGRDRDSHRRGYDAPRDRDRDRYGSNGGYGRDRDFRDSSSYSRDPYSRDQYSRDPYSSRSGGGHDSRSPAYGESSSGYDRRGGSPPPRSSSRYDRY